ncbi:Auxin responsive SAUR protein [Corchorus olitorius]|uniref:Auxin responsive SAUR protein n=1 Tax=Corchorus olitorius TaxID=93759 RepID=A0A1R3H6U9_9ROSI|nr:Auxin responsive SAUR protein [Corchorus olitorius]
MAKVGKLTKLKSAIKRWPSLTKLTRNSSAIAAAESEGGIDDGANSIPKDLHAVYVGKSRRRYLVGSEIICHPLFQELIDRSSSGATAGGGNIDDEEGGEILVSCEVVLFEHLLWMLENDGAQLGSMEELAEFYTC